MCCQTQGALKVLFTVAVRMLAVGQYFPSDDPDSDALWPPPESRIRRLTWLVGLVGL